MIIKVKNPVLSSKLYSYLDADILINAPICVFDEENFISNKIDNFEGCLVVLVLDESSNYSYKRKAIGGIFSVITTNSGMQVDSLCDLVMREMITLMRGNKQFQPLFYDFIIPFFQTMVVDKNRPPEMIEVLARMRFGNGKIITPALMFNWLTPVENALVFKTLFKKVSSNNSEGTWLSFNIDFDSMANEESFEIIYESLKNDSHKSKLTVLEITEQALRHKKVPPHLMMLRFQKILDLGVQIAIDDFGTSHSNYDRLKFLGDMFTIIKLDKSLIRHEKKGVDRTVAELCHIKAMRLNFLINSMALSPNTKTIVLEGIETKAHLAIAMMVRSMQTDLNILFQGFYISCPTIVFPSCATLELK